MLKHACCVLLLMMAPSAGLAQEFLVKMTASEPKDFMLIARNPEKKVLVVVSMIRKLEFSSTGGELNVQSPKPGTWHLVMDAGTHIITFSAPGFLNLEKRIVFSDDERAKEIEINADMDSFRLARQADRESPRLEHDRILQATEGDTLRFFARATDNSSVKRVLLMHRLKGTAAFDSTELSLLQGDEYAATLIAPAQDVEYYLAAIDQFDNPPAMKRHPGDPFLIRILPRTLPTEGIAEREPATHLPSSRAGGFPWKWIGLGSAGAGALAYFLLNGGSGETGTTSTALPLPPGDPDSR